MGQTFQKPRRQQYLGIGSHYCPEGPFCVGRAKKSMFVRPRESRFSVTLDVRNLLKNLQIAGKILLIIAWIQFISYVIISHSSTCDDLALRTQRVTSGPPLPCGCNLVKNSHFLCFYNFETRRGSWKHFVFTGESRTQFFMLLHVVLNSLHWQQNPWDLLLAFRPSYHWNNLKSSAISRVRNWEWLNEVFTTSTRTESLQLHSVRNTFSLNVRAWEIETHVTVFGQSSTPSTQ